MSQEQWTVEVGEGAAGIAEVVVSVHGYDHKVRGQFVDGAGPSALVSAAKGMPLVVACAGHRPGDRWVVATDSGTEYAVPVDDVGGLQLGVAVVAAAAKEVTVRCTDPTGAVRFELCGGAGPRRRWPWPGTAGRIRHRQASYMRD
ncbi:hypothetical protein ACWEQL_39110 [Kitasatospora sp. NPDC004240]